jgi:puromycin-sensitive aminopeptidase
VPKPQKKKKSTKAPKPRTKPGRSTRTPKLKRKPAEGRRKRAVTRAARKAGTSTRSKSTRARSKPAASDLSFRLDGSLRARNYRLYLEVDPTASAGYVGRVEIEAELSEAKAHFELHATDLEIRSARVRSLRGEPLQARVQVRPASETLQLEIDEPMPEGTVILEIAFTGNLRSDLRGLYAARSGERRYAFTQLEAADARRFFPCLDEPDQKAKFKLAVRTASENTVISNSPGERSEDHGNGEKTVHFAETPLLSSYLVALAVGELVCSEPVYADEVPIRIVHVPGAESMTSFALDTARECLTRLREYFALPYPYAKLDLVAVPDFEIGAMENAGAVFFRETLLLVDEASVSLAEKKRAAEVICHELAHMWYGNLVTMRWWDDLWLNEAFATWMAFDIVAKWRPEWNMWNDFGHARNSALQLDALENTHPIYTEVRTPSEATENFDLITYEKGAAVVRMIERYLGPKVFQRGVRSYIKRHRESNTTASDLWRALSEAAGENVEKVVRPFIEQPGFPVVRISRDSRAGSSSLRLQQERFDARGPSQGSEKRAAPALWPVPWVGRVGRLKTDTRKPGGARKNADPSDLARHLLRKRSERIPLEHGQVRYIYGNADEGGFFRPLHDPRELSALVEALPELAVSERLGFVQHQWALVRAGYASLPEFLPLVAALTHEREADVLRALHAPLEHLLYDVARSKSPELAAHFQAFVAETFDPAWSELGWGPARARAHQADNDDAGAPLLRAELVQLVGVLAESATAVAEAEARFHEYMARRESLDPNLIAPVLTLAARRADAQRLEQLLLAAETEPTPQARRRFRLAVADVREPVLASSLLLTCLTTRIPTQDVAFVVARLLRNPDVQELAFEFVQERWSELRERIPAMLMSRLIEATPALRTEAHRRQLQQFFSRNPLPTAARALRQANERFRLNAAFRARATRELSTFLRTRTANHS